MGYHKLPRTEEMVSDILMRYPKTKNSDELLTIYLYRDYYGIGNETFSDVLLMRSAKGMPSMETIGRCRRKLQEALPMVYGSSGETKKNRRKAENEFREYARR